MVIIRLLTILILLIPSIVSGITISLDSIVVRPNKQLVFFTITHDSVDYLYHAAIPLSADSTIHIQAQIDIYMIQIYREMYRQAPHNLNSIAQWEAWIMKGAIGNNGQVVIKKPFTGKHPEWIRLIQNTSAAMSVPDLRAIILEMLENQ